MYFLYVQMLMNLSDLLSLFIDFWSCSYSIWKVYERCPKLLKLSWSFIIFMKLYCNLKEFCVYNFMRLYGSFPQTIFLEADWLLSETFLECLEVLWTYLEILQKVWTHWGSIKKIVLRPNFFFYSPIISDLS